MSGFADLLDASAGAAVELQMNLRHRLPACMIDASHLEAALLNIVVNARDAMPDGGTVPIATSKLHLNGDLAARDLPSDDYVTLSVTDEGIGMVPCVVPRAVEPFFTTKGVGRGTGLGLAMVHCFLQQSRGRLEIGSELGRGTTVRMILPLHSEDADAVAPSAKQAPIIATRATNRRKAMVKRSWWSEIPTMRGRLPANTWLTWATEC